MEVIKNQKLKGNYQEYITAGALKYLNKKVVLGIVLLSFFAYYDYFITHNLSAFLTRLIPISIAIPLFILNLTSSKYNDVKLKIYNTFLINAN